MRVGQPHRPVTRRFDAALRPVGLSMTQRCWTAGSTGWTRPSLDIASGFRSLTSAAGGERMCDVDMWRLRPASRPLRSSDTHAAGHRVDRSPRAMVLARYGRRVATDRYDRIGRSYAVPRRADPRIAALLLVALGDARTVVNVGAGTGSNEPSCRCTTVRWTPLSRCSRSTTRPTWAAGSPSCAGCRPRRWCCSRLPPAAGRATPAVRARAE